MSNAIAIVGMACRYPDANSPAELWENVLSQRRSFRRIPAERLRIDDYFSADRTTPDTTYSVQAAVLEGYEFDRARFRVAGSTYRQADMAHWLALDVAATALADAGFPEGKGLPNDGTGVLVGNSLTGEFSRANLMRLRWPYVQRVLDGALHDRGWSEDDRREFLATVEEQYKQPFPAVGDETLAGGLSNTIAGRICNHFDLHGGGYTVDGACSSSLLATANACVALAMGDVDLMIAGGVDLSLDPFELIGFAKVGALAEDDMRVYDQRSSGFWPGEGCGMVVLMRAEDAAAENRRVYATIRGWGISSDGSGGITRPEVNGQRLALERAYRRAGFGIDTIGYFEGHGTGTHVGDTVELQTISELRRQASTDDTGTAYIGSIKANIGHTKAAAGVAGLIKATLALHNQLVPPNSGSDQPHEELQRPDVPLRQNDKCRGWPADAPLRSAVSAMGFGGINSHIVLEATPQRRRSGLDHHQRNMSRSWQDCELFLLAGSSHAEVADQVSNLMALAGKLSRAELGDLAALLSRNLGHGRVRTAVVASSPDQLEDSLRELLRLLNDGADASDEAERGIFLGTATTPPVVGFLFPGQGSPARIDGGIWRRRFENVDQLYQAADLPDVHDSVATDVAQPAIVTSCLAGLDLLDRLDIRAAAAIGHSLGELVAYHWGGAMDQATLLRLAHSRGTTMASHGSFGGAMASVSADAKTTDQWIDGEDVVIAGINSPQQTVVSGHAEAVDEVVARARLAGIDAIMLPVSHAFHSPLVAKSADAFKRVLSHESLGNLQRTVASTVTGKTLNIDADLASQLVAQIVSPVRFIDALESLPIEIDLWIEVGPGNVQSGIVRQMTAEPVIAVDAGGTSLKGILCATAAAYVMGTPVQHRALFEGRFHRTMDLDWKPKFLANPCEQAPVIDPLRTCKLSTCESSPGQRVATDRDRDKERNDIAASDEASPVTAPRSSNQDATPLEVVRRLVATRSELPLATVQDADRLLSDLHLSSIAVGHLVGEAFRELQLSPPTAPTEFADASVLEIANALDALMQTGSSPTVTAADEVVPGVDEWVRPFVVDWVETARSGGPVSPAPGQWQVFSTADDRMSQEMLRVFRQSVAGPGIIVLLPADDPRNQIPLLVNAAQAALKMIRGSGRFVVIESGRGGAAVAKTLHLERPDITTLVIHVPANDPRSLPWAVSEAQAIEDGYHEIRYDTDGTRRTPILRVLNPDDGDGAAPALNSSDVLFVTGGGKGIAAECALSLAKTYGLSVGLLGRSRPEDDDVLRSNLERFAAEGIPFHYAAADVTCREQTRRAIETLESRLGSVTAMIHGAGTNVPKMLASLSAEDFEKTLAPKYDGLHHVLDAIDSEKLRCLVTFGSIIARMGMPGEADYAFANDWLTWQTEQWQASHPHCRCLALESSVWSGVGMGERLGRIEALRNAGVTAIRPDQGVQILQQLLSRRLPRVATVVTGRFGRPATLQLESPQLPLFRFLEEPRVHVPGIELVVDVELTHGTDPYLGDHVYQNAPLFPAVMGMEAMAEAVVALTGWRSPPSFENLEFSRPVVVAERSKTTIRIAAMLRNPNQVDVVLRSEETGFQVDHFRCVCRPVERNDRLGGSPTLLTTRCNGKLPIEPGSDLYGNVLFHTGRFCRLTSYHHLQATECIADLSPPNGETWFAPYLPTSFVLGDPAARDATIHAIQACIPHGTILPIGAEAVVVGQRHGTTPTQILARERFQNGDHFVYDVEVTDAEGNVCEFWDGLQLQRVAATAPKRRWSEALLAPYVERRIGELLPSADVAVALEYFSSHQRNGDRAALSDRVLRNLVGSDVGIYRRADGKPTTVDAGDVSVAHAEQLTLAVSSANRVSCDLETVTVQSREHWQGLLGEESFALAKLVSRDASEDVDTAATRVWVALECRQKVGASADAPLTLREKLSDGWILLGAGRFTVATWVGDVHRAKAPLVLGVLVEEPE